MYSLRMERASLDRGRMAWRRETPFDFVEGHWLPRASNTQGEHDSPHDLDCVCALRDVDML